MKIAIAQQNYHIGNFDANFSKIESAVVTAKMQGADIVVFSELAVCGYPPRDFLEFEDFIARCQAIIEKVKNLSNNIAIVVGSPSVNPVVEGKDLYNSAYFIANRKILHTQHKALLPTYDIFDEYRYFEPATEFTLVHYKGKKIALTICEDIWNIGNENPLYPTCPMDEYQAQQPDIMLNLSASPFSAQHAKERIRIVQQNATQYQVPVFYVNNCGAQTELIFDGGSLVVAPNGGIYDELPYFQECVKTYTLANIQHYNTQHPIQHRQQPKDKMPLIHQALLTGIKDYFGKLGFSKAILGLSGGVDSALVCALAAQALGGQNVRAVLMPSQFSSNHSINDSLALVKNLNCKHDIIPIQVPFNTMQQSLKETFAGTSFDVTEENIQARLRAVILMGISNKFGYILLNTSNKSEAAVGYGTLYGDMCGGLSVIGDLYKTEVYQLCQYINRQYEIIPNHILIKPPSAELRPNQKDSDSLPDYDLLDEVLFQYIEKRQGPKALIAMGFNETLVKRVLKLVNTSEYKRYQTPPMLRVSPKAFGMGRRMPIVGKYLS